VVCALVALLVVLAGPARLASASSVSGVTVNNSSPSAAAGAQTTYVVTFTTSPNGALRGTSITLVFPSGTGLGSVSTSSVDDTTTGTNGLGACNPPSGETITCFINPGAFIAATDSVRVTLKGVTNPTTPSDSLTLSVSTSTDTTPVNSSPYSVLSAGGQVSGPAVNNSSPSATAGAQTTYVVTFTTSKTGGLSSPAGITLVFPSGTGLESVSSSSVDDTTTGANGVGACKFSPPDTFRCFLNAGAAIAAGDGVRITLKGVINPSTPSSSLTVSVSTTSDTTPVKSAPYTVSPPPPVPGKSVDITPASGVVLVRRPGQKTFIRLQAGQQIPLGSVVNATAGVVTVVAATYGHGHTATGQAYGGLFRITQRLTTFGTEVTVMTLAGPKPTGCAARAARAARPRRHRALTFRDPGPFKTIGIYAWGRGQAASKTTWLTEDTCAGTLIKVVRGTVIFDDIPHHRKFLLQAGQSFLAHPGKGG
jgi:hypothetical protein